MLKLVLATALVAIAAASPFKEVRFAGLHANRLAAEKVSLPHIVNHLFCLCAPVPHRPAQCTVVLR